MPLQKRILKVDIAMPEGLVTLDNSLQMHIRVKKVALALQDTCTIEVMNLSSALREQLLSQFTAWQQRRAGEGLEDQPYIHVDVFAGYSTGTASDTPSMIFKGEIVRVTPLSGPPSIGISIECFAQQFDKKDYKTDTFPTSLTYKDYVKWVADQMEVQYVCETKWDNDTISNPSAATGLISQLIVDLQTVRPRVAAFLTNGQLIVRDIDRLMSISDVIKINQFIGIPQWTEWGVEFQVLFDRRLNFPGAVDLSSKLNPSLDGQYVYYSLEYDLASRDTPFYVKVAGSPPA